MKLLRPVRFSPLAAAFSCALAAALPLGLVAAPAYSQSAASGDLDRAVAALRGISTMRADFSQTDRQGQVAGGVMTLKRPGKIRFQYEKSVRSEEQTSELQSLMRISSDGFCLKKKI